MRISDWSSDVCSSDLRQSAWFLFGLAFIVVYREVFETILFYAALWTQGNGGVMVAGAGSAALILVAVAWAMLRYRSEEHTSELQSLMRISYAVFCLKKKKQKSNNKS